MRCRFSGKTLCRVLAAVLAFVCLFSAAPCAAQKGDATAVSFGAAAAQSGAANSAALRRKVRLTEIFGASRPGQILYVCGNAGYLIPSAEEGAGMLESALPENFRSWNFSRALGDRSRVLALANRISAANAPLGETPFLPEDGLLLNADWEKVWQVGKQTSSGPCASFCLAYARTILDGKTANWHLFDSEEGAVWYMGNFVSRRVFSERALLHLIYSSLCRREPVIINVSGGRSNGCHWLTVVGFTGVSGPDELSAEDLLVLDPAGHVFEVENMALLGYSFRAEGGGYRYAVPG